MSIATLTAYEQAARQRILYTKSTSGFVSSTYYSNVRIAGGTPAASGPPNNTSGIVPTNALTGYPVIAAFSGTAYITGIEASLLSSNSAFAGYRFLLADLLWYAGSYTGSSAVTLSSQPSFASRVPNSDYNGLQLWSEGVGGSAAGTTSLAVGYTNQDGTTGRVTPATDIDRALSNVGLQAQQFALFAGDTGLQKVESVTGSGGAFTANLMIVRPLVYGRVTWLHGKAVQRYWLDRSGMPQVFADSALISLVACEGSPSALNTAPMELRIEIAAA